MFVSLSFGIVLPPPNTPLSMPCRLRFNFAFTGRRSLDLRVTQASQATMGDVLRLMYKHAKCIPANAGVGVDRQQNRGFPVKGPPQVFVAPVPNIIITGSPYILSTPAQQ